MPRQGYRLNTDAVYLLRLAPDSQPQLQEVFRPSFPHLLSSEGTILRTKRQVKHLLATIGGVYLVSPQGAVLAQFTTDSELPDLIVRGTIRPGGITARGILPENTASHRGGHSARSLRAEWHELQSRECTPKKDLRHFGQAVLWALPLEPEKCPAFGCLGKLGRTRIARLSYNSGKPQLRVRHVAAGCSGASGVAGSRRSAHQPKTLIALAVSASHSPSPAQRLC